jgi:hypothetical protein
MAFLTVYRHCWNSHYCFWIHIGCVGDVVVSIWDWYSRKGCSIWSWVYLTTDSQSTSLSWYRALLSDPWPDFILILSLVTICFVVLPVGCPLWRDERRVCNLQCNRWLVRSLRTNTIHYRLMRMCSRSHIATDGQSVRSSWCLAPLGAGDHMLHLFEW